MFSAVRISAGTVKAAAIMPPSIRNPSAMPRPAASMEALWVAV